MDRLVPENGLLTVFLPAYGAFVFRVLERTNRNYEVFNYGAVPTTTSMTLPTYDGGSASPSASGTMPARAYMENGVSFSLSGAFDETDMWYLNEDYRDRVFHVFMEVYPRVLRVDVQIPKNTSQGKFQKDKVITGVPKDFGFRRGGLEVVHLPRIHYGYRFGNDTNIEWRTFVRFIYGEYVVEIPKDEELIFDVLTMKVRSHWVTLPVNVTDETIRTALEICYGFTGFPLYPVNKKDEAVREYSSLLSRAKI